MTSIPHPSAQALDAPRARAVACYLLASPNGRTRAFASYDAAMRARHVNDAVTEIMEGEDL